MIRLRLGRWSLATSFACPIRRRIASSGDDRGRAGRTRAASGLSLKRSGWLYPPRQSSIASVWQGVSLPPPRVLTRAYWMTGGEDGAVSIDAVYCAVYPQRGRRCISMRAATPPQFDASPPRTRGGQALAPCGPIRAFDFRGHSRDPGQFPRVAYEQIVFIVPPLCCGRWRTVAEMVRPRSDRI